MSVFDHPVLKQPEDREIKIWRYMDFTKLVFTLEESGLFFPRLDRLGDPFEGSVPRKNVVARLEQWKPYYGEKTANAFQIGFAQFFQWQKQWTYVNCWHMNEFESAAMWRLYARSEEAICIQSTYQCLRESLDKAPCREGDGVFLGTVEYIDYDGECVPDDWPLRHVVHKRRSFAHEQELRAIVWRCPEFPDRATINIPPDTSKEDYPENLPKDGIWIKLDLERLVENIYVAPASPKWFHHLVEKVVNRYGLHKPVRQSLLDASPIY
jgi:hypothetical protein